MTREPTPAPEPDVGLVDAARRGDPAAQDRLVSLHHEVAWRVAVGVLKDEDAAADAVQNAFLKAFRNLDGFRGESRFRTWLLSIVVNEARGALRRRTRRRESGLDDVGPVADEARPVDHDVVMRDEARRARALVEELPEKQRLAVTLRIDEGLSFREIGELIGSSEGAARVNYHHGIRRLREKMTG
ncbi:MAG: RNA polymerase sigma factor [Longimicrobiales bacterium]